eukprot:6316735-Alexandrium_andersonii.AAC.1
MIQLHPRAARRPRYLWRRLRAIPMPAPGDRRQGRSAIVARSTPPALVPRYLSHEHDAMHAPNPDLDPTGNLPSIPLKMPSQPAR